MKPRLKVSDVNPHVKCTICDGYLVDATAIVECLHAFCRTCIVRYLESNRFCPVCDVQVHETKPLLSIRSDQTLQDVVYKVVPELYQNEMRRRRDFYAEHPEAADLETLTPEDLGRGEPRFFTARESISLSLQHRPKEGKAPPPAHVEDSATRHLSCPAAFTVAHLKKFVRLKFGLPDTLVVDLFYEDDPLRDDYALMDVAYMHSWKRAEPMRFFFSVSKRLPPAPALPPEAVQEESSEGDQRPMPSEVPRPAYNSVKVDLHAAPHNGFRLKFIHDPDILRRPSKKRHRHHHHRTKPRPTPSLPHKEPETPPTHKPELMNGERSPPTVIEAEDCEKDSGVQKDDDNSCPSRDPVSCSEPIWQAESLCSTATNDNHQQLTVAEKQQSEVCESMEETCQEKANEEEKEEEGPSQSRTTAAAHETTDERQQDEKKESDRGSPPDGPWNRDDEKELFNNELPSKVNREESSRNVADSISAEFSDDDDLGCQADLVVDEGGKNEEEEDLRKKIEAIAEADDEADSGRASDMSCGPASSSRSACEEEAFSPVAPAPPKEEKVAPRQQSNKSSIDHVIQQLYLRGCSATPKVPTRPKEESAGALDLSTTPCGATRKEEHHRARVAVANPVLDTKHRQQTYMPAPKQQHTACAPAPRQPLHHAAPSILQAQLTKQAPRTPHPYGRPPPPSYGYRFGGGQGMFSNMLPYSSIVGMVRGGMVPLRKDFLHSRMPFACGSPQPRDVSKQQHPSLRHVCRTSDMSTTVSKQQTSLRNVYRTSNVPMTGSPKQSSLRDICRTSNVPVTSSPKQASLRGACKTSDVPMTGNPKQTSLRDVCRTSDVPLTNSPKQTSLRDVCRTSDVPMMGSPKQTSLRDVCRTSDVPMMGSPKQTSLRDVCRTSDVPMMGNPKQTSLRDVCRTSDVVAGIPKQTSLRDTSSPSRRLPSPVTPSNNHVVHKRSDHCQGGEGRGGSKYRRTLSGGAQLAVFNPDPNEYSRLVIKKMDGGPIK